MMTMKMMKTMVMEIETEIEVWKEVKKEEVLLLTCPVLHCTVLYCTHKSLHSYCDNQFTSISESYSRHPHLQIVVSYSVSSYHISHLYSILIFASFISFLSTGNFIIPCMYFYWSLPVLIFILFYWLPLSNQVLSLSICIALWIVLHVLVIPCRYLLNNSQFLCLTRSVTFFHCYIF